MISALAFGYGVGMATPDSTIADVHGAVMRARTPGAAPATAPYGPYAYGHQWAGYGPTAPPGWAPPPGYAGYAPPPGYAPPGYAGYPVPARAHDVPPNMAEGSHESRELSRLREVEGPDGAHCNLHRPLQSEPRYASEPRGDDEAGYEEVDDLDPAAREALSRLQLPDFEVSITRRALKYVRFLTRTDRGRDMFATWLKRSGRYQELLQQTLREFHLPEDLIWVAMIESGFDPKAKSPAGAVGLWQFMRSTGRVYGLEQTTYEDDRKNPVKATRAAAHHLRDLFQRFGAWDLALAAYNMGYEQLLNRIDRYGTTDFNELARQRALPSETAAYVPKIIAAALVANNLERYGFEDIKAYKPLHHAELMVPGGTRLKTLARAAGVSSATLRTFNPHLTRDYVPPSGDHIVYIPAGTLSRARAALPAMLQDDRHVVSDVDVLAPDDLVGLSKNRERQWSKDENLLRLLPKPQRRSMRSMLRDKRSAADDPIAGMAEEFAPKRADRETVMYRVGTGDTLIGIAKQFAIDVDDLARDNNLEADERLREGALLKLSVKRRVLDKWKRSVGRERGVEASAAKRSKTEG